MTHGDMHDVICMYHQSHHYTGKCVIPVPAKLKQLFYAYTHLDISHFNGHINTLTDDDSGS